MTTPPGHKVVGHIKHSQMEAEQIGAEHSPVVEPLATMTDAAALDEHAALKEENERLTHLHKLDHSLADQWLARAEKAEAGLEDWREKYAKLEARCYDDGFPTGGSVFSELKKAEAEVERLRADRDIWRDRAMLQQGLANDAEAELAEVKPLVEAALELGGDCVLSQGDDQRLKRLRYAAAALALRQEKEVK